MPERSTRAWSGREHLFVATAGISTDAADYFNLPREQTVFMGSQFNV